MPFTTTPTVRVHWEESGQGPALVLLHGLGGDIGFWADDTAYLEQQFRVIRIDLRGSGATPASAGGHTMDDLADDVAAVLADAGIDRAGVVGFSMGGNVAQALAVRHPELVDRLVLASTFATMNRRARRFLDAVLDVYANGATAKQMFDLICPWLFSPDFVADERNGPYFQYPEDDPDEQPMEDWRELYLAQQRFDSQDRLGRIQAPTLVLAGEHDQLVSLGDAAQLTAGIPSAQQHVVRGAGHLVNLERPEEFWALIRRFIAH